MGGRGEGTRCGGGGCRRVRRRACTEAGFDDGSFAWLVFHELRHTAALAIDQGAHPVATKEWLRHSSISVTMNTNGGLFPGHDDTIGAGLDEPFSQSPAASPRPGDRT